MNDEVCYNQNPPVAPGEETVLSVTVWGDFEIHHEQVLGRGGMGLVVRARQLSLDRTVAVKILDLTRAHTQDEEQGFLERFQLEAKALARVRDPRIISIIQAGKNDGRCWFAMEMVDGETVERRLNRGSFPEREAARIGAEVARALDAAHRAGIIHRDVKPPNIFLCPDGAVKLGDWGLAKAADFQPTKLTSLNAVACTPAYVSPEAAQGKPVDHRSDMYALGCVLYEMLTERPPFQSDSNMELLFKHCQEPPLPPKVLNPEVSSGLEVVILKCLAKEPEFRYQTYKELIDDLEAVVAETPLPQTEPPPVEIITPPPSRRTGWLWALAGVVGLVLITAAVRRQAARTEPKGAPPPVAMEEEKEQEKKEAPQYEEPKKEEPRKEIKIALPVPDATPPEPWTPTADELAAIRRIRAVLERHDAEIQRHEYEAALTELEKEPQPTERTAGIRDAEIRRLRAAARLSKTGDVDADPIDRLFWRATHGDPIAALQDIGERHHLVHAICLREIEVRGRDVLNALDKLDLPAWALEPRKALEYEVTAIEFLEKKDHASVLTKREGSRAWPKAARAVYESASFTQELIAQVGFLDWERKGDAAFEDGAFRLAAGATLTRSVESARRGFRIRFRGAGTFALEFAPERYVEISKEEVTLFRERGAVAEREASGDVLTLVPQQDLVLIYLGERLIFVLAAEDYGLDGGVVLGARTDSVFVESLKVGGK